MAWRLGGLEARWLYGSVSPRFGSFWVPWSGLSRLASMSSALLGALRVEMLQNVAVAKEWLVFLNKCCCGSGSGGVPLPFGDHSNIFLAFTHICMVFMVFEATRG